MNDTIPAIERGSVVISPEHIRELRVLLGEVRKQQYAPATCGHNNNAAVELAGYLRALVGPEPMPPATRHPEQALPRPRMPAQVPGGGRGRAPTRSLPARPGR
jgi:hypothetical protein